MWLLGVSRERKAASSPVRRSTPRIVPPARPWQNGRVPWIFLAVSVVGAWFTVNAFRPSSRWQFIGTSFFAAWLTGELAVWNIVWQAVATAVFVALGALDGWPGWLGSAITLASWVGLVVIAAISRRSGGVFDSVLTDGLGIGPVGPAHREVDPGRVPLPAARPAGRAHQEPRVRARTASATSSTCTGPGTAGPVPTAAPVLLQIHGGAWVIGDKSQQGLPLMLQLASEGWVCVAINYRLSPKATWPEHLVDCKRALAWVREHIAEYGGDPDLICVTGGSAGGHLAAMVALTANEPRFQPGFEDADTSVAACVPFYGVYDFVSMFAGDRAKDRAARLLARWVMKATPEEDPDAFADASPVSHVRADAPPFFVIHGTNDNLAPVGQAREFVERAARGVGRAGALRRGAGRVARVRRLPLDPHRERGAARSTASSPGSWTATAPGTPDRTPRTSGSRRRSSRCRAPDALSGGQLLARPGRSSRRMIRTLNGIDRSDDHGAYGATSRPASMTSGTS